MEQRAVTSSISFAQFHPTVAMAAARTSAQRAAALGAATPNRFGPLFAASSAVRVKSAQSAPVVRVASVLQSTAPTSRTAVTNDNISDVKNGPLAKAGQELINLYLDYQAFKAAGGEGTFRSTHAPSIQVVGNNVRIDVKGASGTASALAGLGMNIESNDPRTGIIEGLLPIAQLPNAAQLSQVTMIGPVHYPRTR